MDVSLQHTDALVRPWRTAALVAVAVAAIELLVLVVVGGALLTKPSTGTHSATKVSGATHAHHAKATAGVPHRTPAPAAHLARRSVSVLVLNGNGRQGAAASTAARVSHRGSHVSGVANAPRSDFTRSLVMYRKGFEGEGRRLATDLGIHIVGPLDGLRVSQLHGAHAVVVVGA